MRLALFDFDGTITKGDTFLRFLHHTVGTPRYVRDMLLSSPVLLGYLLGLLRNDHAKEQLLRRFFAGYAHAGLVEAGRCFAAGGIDSLLRPSMLERVRRHRQEGYACVLVSASLDVYVRHWGLCFGFDEVLATRLEVTESGLVSGRIAGANCHGAEKVARITEWLDGRVPEHVVAYGDSRGDEEMLAFADCAFFVEGSWSRTRLRPVTKEASHGA